MATTSNAVVERAASAVAPAPGPASETAAILSVIECLMRRRDESAAKLRRAGIEVVR